MSKFVELTDYDASIHRDILDALVREDETVIEVSYRTAASGSPLNSI